MASTDIISHPSLLRDAARLPNGIRTENVTRHYAMGDATIRAVDGSRSKSHAGDFVALLGSSGSGKSSLLNLIAGLDRPTAGSIVVHGSDLAELSRPELAQYRLHTVGMVFQSFNLIRDDGAGKRRAPLSFAEVDRSQRADSAGKLSIASASPLASTSAHPALRRRATTRRSRPRLDKPAQASPR